MSILDSHLFSQVSGSFTETWAGPFSPGSFRPTHVLHQDFFQPWGCSVAALVPKEQEFQGLCFNSWHSGTFSAPVLIKLVASVAIFREYGTRKKNSGLSFKNFEKKNKDPLGSQGS